MESLYDLLRKNQKRRTKFARGKEYRYFLKYRHLLDTLPQFSFLFESGKNHFNVMRANIILKSLENKKNLEALLSKADLSRPDLKEYLANETLSYPVFNSGSSNILIAFFTKALNNIYLLEPSKLSQIPYNNLKKDFALASIDPFDTYGYQIYNSSFTSLILIKENPNHKEAAFFHYDTNTIYFVNDQGRLDAELVLFDKYMKKPSYSHMLERMLPVVDAYFAFDRPKMIEALHDNKFISGRLMSILRRTTGNYYNDF